MAMEGIAAAWLGTASRRLAVRERPATGLIKAEAVRKCAAADREYFVTT